MREIRKAVFSCAFRFLFLFATRSLHAMLPDFTFKWHDISHFWMDSEFKWNCSNCSLSLAQNNK